MRRGLVAAFVLCALLFVVPSRGALAAPTPTPSQKLARARAEFERGDYKKVCEALEPELLPTPTLREKPELTARLAQARARIYEVPISYSGRTYAEGKKIRWTDGVAAFWHIVKFNLFSERAPVYRNSVAATRPAGPKLEAARSSSESSPAALAR